jgi:hypothetical protein
MNCQDAVQRRGKRWQYPFGPSTTETIDYMVGQLGVDYVLMFEWGFYPDPEVSSKAWMEGETIHKTWITPSGKLHAAINYNDAWPYGLDIPLFSDYLPAHYAEPWAKSMRDVECLRHMLHPPRSKETLELIRFRLRETKRLADMYGLATCFSSGTGLTGAVHIFGPTAVCELALTNPDLVDAYLELEHQLNLRNYELAMDLGLDMVRRNGFYETCDLFSPALLEQFLFRRLQEEIRLVHAGGRVIGYTQLTGIMPLLDYLERLEFDCLICPDVFYHGMDAVKINAVLGDKKSFWTGPSDTLHMPWDKPEEVRQAVRHVFNAFGKTGLILTPCSSSKAVFPWANVLAMVDEWKTIRK